MIDTADSVMHKPTGNKLIVACVYEGRVYWIGWPAGSAPIEEFALLKKAKPSDRKWWLKEISKPGQPDSDDRTRIVRRQLGHNG